jgi:hypothetical protein
MIRRIVIRRERPRGPYEALVIAQEGTRSVALGTRDLIEAMIRSGEMYPGCDHLTDTEE